MAPEQRAVVWDLDGVIVDSAAAHNLSWSAMAREFGLPYDPERDFKANFGRHNTDIITSQWGVTDPSEIERMAISKETSFREAARELKPLPGVLELARAIEQAGWKQGIGSSAPIENINLLLSVTGLAPYMQAVTSAEDVTRGKPDPRVFLIAFERLGVSPRNGVVIEDAPAGVQGAIAAGAACLAVTTTQTRQALKEAGAHLVVSSLAQVTIRDLEELIRARVRS